MYDDKNVEVSEVKINLPKTKLKIKFDGIP